MFPEFGLAHEGHVNVISAHTVSQAFTAVVTKGHPAGLGIRFTGMPACPSIDFAEVLWRQAAIDISISSSSVPALQFLQSEPIE